MTNILRGAITILFSAEVDESITDVESLLSHYGERDWQFGDFAQTDDAEDIVTWDRECGVTVDEIIQDSGLEDEYALRAR